MNRSYDMFCSFFNLTTHLKSKRLFHVAINVLQTCYGAKHGKTPAIFQDSVSFMALFFATDFSQRTCIVVFSHLFLKLVQFRVFLVDSRPFCHGISSERHFHLFQKHVHALSEARRSVCNTLHTWFSSA